MMFIYEAIIFFNLINVISTQIVRSNRITECRESKMLM